jgi:uncharacterized protein (TIGR02594 family)
MKQAYELAKKEIGTKEVVGSKHNPSIVQYFADVGHDWVKDDETAWCAAFVGSVLKRVGMPHTGKLNARSYLGWGEKVELENAQEGDIVVFSRGSSSWQGHVAFLVKVNKDALSVLGGNQSNAVNVSSYSKENLLGIRRMSTKATKKNTGLSFFLATLFSIFRRKK